MKIEHLEDIEAWQPARIATQSVAGGLARELTHKVYRLTKKQGFEKDYGLKRQIQNVRGETNR
ncbi:MAG: four helix bundle protein [Verrucomicrobia bacterium]|nr:four helix bundle protein [Verrucomicrobiota bacterium]MBU4285349.1 four helix bundle protein [Verrucomicrobiota bacterium]